MGDLKGNFVYRLFVCLVLLFGIITLSGVYAEVIPGMGSSENSRITAHSALNSYNGEVQNFNQLSSTYDTYTYTHSDILLFSYSNGTQFEVYNNASELVWNGTINAGGHEGLSSSENVTAGIYKIKGTNPYSVLIGDAISSTVMGYYAIDENGNATSKKMYTYQVHSYSAYGRVFGVFAYENLTSVNISNSVTGENIWSGTLNAGEHYGDTNLTDTYVTVSATKPVSALSYTDQGYYIPASSGTFIGKEFYSYVGDTYGWLHDLNLIAYNDNTTVNVTNSETGASIWNGMLNANSVQSVPFENAAYVTIKSDKDINAGSFPYGSWNSGYYYLVYAEDTSGTGIGTRFVFPAIANGKMVIFSYSDNALTKVVNSVGAEIWSGYLNNGEFKDLVISTKDVYQITSTNSISVIYYYGNSAGADFSPVYYSQTKPPYVTLTQPNGGEIWYGNETRNITWYGYGTGSLSVDLYYSTTGLTGTYLPIVSGLSNTGLYSWNIPNNINTTQASVKVILTDSLGRTVSDTSDSVFTIYPDPINKLTVKINQIDNSSFKTIVAYVSVSDQHDYPISGLTAANFLVTEDTTCRPNFTVTPVSDANKSLSLITTVDHSGSMSYSSIAASNIALKHLINISAADDKLAILKFSTYVEEVQNLTTNKTLLLEKVDSMPDYPEDMTALYDSIYDAVALVKTETNRKAIIGFTDGYDTASSHSYADMLSYAKQENIPVYMIGLGYGVNTDELKEIANQTGGKYYYSPTADQITDIYSQISQSLNGQYIITYDTCNSSCDSTWRNLTVGATYSGLSGSDTKGYLAPSSCGNNSPQSDFNGTPTMGCAPLTVQFTDLSTGSPTSWNWSFGDGSYSANASPAHTFTLPGSYQVSLSVANAYGADTKTVPGYINVSPTPLINATADIGGSIYPNGTVSVSCGTNQTFTITPDACYLISDVIVDGQSQGPITQYTFPNVLADHSIRVQFSQKSYTINATAGTGGSIYPSGNVSVSCGSDKRFVMIPDTYFKVLSVLVDGSDIGKADNYTFTNITGDHTINVTFANAGFTINATADPYTIDHPYGVKIYAEGENKTYITQAKPGSELLNVEVDNITFGPGDTWSFLNISENHDIATIGQYVPGQTHASFRMNETYGPAPLAVQFTDESFGNPTSWYWQFGDGKNSTEQNPINVYTMPGVYSVVLYASNGKNRGVGVWNNAITVTNGIVPKPTATPVPSDITTAFTATPVTGTAPLQVTFQDLSTGNPTYWLWKFGDGKFSLQKNPTHWYYNPGTYSVSLQVQNKKSGGSLTKQGFIVVR